jgi:hypothetical protein
MIPKMTYAVYKINRNKQIHKECVDSIKKQSNVKNIVYINPNFVFFNIYDDWVVHVENDVCLKDGWIEEMWKYRDEGDVIVGRAVEHPKIKKYKEKTTKVEQTEEHYIQCSLARGYALMTRAIWVSVPVISYHCPTYIHNPYRQGTKEKLPLKRIIRTVLGGIKIAIKERHWIFARNAILRGAGMLMRKLL